MGGSTTGDEDDIPYSNVNDISNSADHDTKVVSVRGNKHTATHRAVPHRSAAGASASISISIPSSRLNNTKGSLGGEETPATTKCPATLPTVPYLCKLPEHPNASALGPLCDI